MVKNTSPQTASWLKLFLASKESGISEAPVNERPPGRPRKQTVTEKTTVYLSESDLKLLDAWKGIFSEVYGKKVYRSEVIQIILRIAEDRLEAIGGSEGYAGIEAFYDALVHAPTSPQTPAAPQGAPVPKKRASTRKASAAKETAE